MIRHILTIIALSLTSAIYAVAPSQLARQADEAYSANDFDTAIDLYEKAIAEDGVSSDLYYNYGNALYRADRPAHAIVAYERALRLDPGNKDARTNLDFVNNKLGASTEVSSYASAVAEKSVEFMSPNSWAVLGLILFVLTLALVAGYLLSHSVKTRKICFFSAIPALFLTIASTYIAVKAKDKLTDATQAIVVVPSSQLVSSPTSPNDPSKQAFMLREGTKVFVLDSLLTTYGAVPKWYEVKVNDQLRAWIDARHIVII